MKKGCDRYTDTWNDRKMQILCQFIWQSKIKRAIFREKTYTYQVVDIATWLTWPPPNSLWAASLHSRNYISHVPLSWSWACDLDPDKGRHQSRTPEVKVRSSGWSGWGGRGGGAACAETSPCGKGIGFHQGSCGRGGVRWRVVEAVGLLLGQSLGGGGNFFSLLSMSLTLPEVQETV